MKKFMLQPPDSDDLMRLLDAWRVWIVGAILGAAIASIVYLISPPQYRAQATVIVDQNVEQVIPQEQTDLRKFNYLQRETDKLVEIAWADQTLARVSIQTGLPVSKLRDGRLLLSQPGDGGWHFLADAPDPVSAARLASAWAGAFVEVVQSKPAGISALVAGQFYPATGSASYADRLHGNIYILRGIVGNYPACVRLAFLRLEECLRWNWFPKIFFKGLSAFFGQLY